MDRNNKINGEQEGLTSTVWADQVFYDSNEWEVEIPPAPYQAVPKGEAQQDENILHPKVAKNAKMELLYHMYIKKT